MRLPNITESLLFLALLMVIALSLELNKTQQELKMVSELLGKFSDELASKDAMINGYEEMDELIMFYFNLWGQCEDKLKTRVPL